MAYPTSHPGQLGHQPQVGTPGYSAGPTAAPGYGYGQPVESEDWANRKLLIVLAIVLAGLVLVCGGVIVYLVQDGGANGNAMGPVSTASVNPSANQDDTAPEWSGATSYRRVEHADAGGRLPASGWVTPATMTT
jgi:serine/threonine-protein kinase